MKKKLCLLISTFMLVSTLASPAYSSEIEHVIGWGMGLPYGGIIGANYELGVNDYFAPTIGLGVLPDNIGWNLGARLYYPGREAKFRGRITALFGVNSLRERNDNFVGGNYDTETGLSGGLGFNWRFGQKWAFDADIFAVDQDIPPGYEKAGPDTKFSLGFSLRW